MGGEETVASLSQIVHRIYRVLDDRVIGGTPPGNKRLTQKVRHAVRENYAE